MMYAYRNAHAGLQFSITFGIVDGKTEADGDLPRLHGRGQRELRGQTACGQDVFYFAGKAFSR